MTARTGARWAGALLLAATAPWWPGNSLNIASAAAVATLGIAHGAVDPVLAGRRRSRRFYLGYLTVAAVVLAGWTLSSHASLAAFVLVSMWHFGEGDTRPWPRRTTWEAWTRGAFVVVTPLSLHWADVAPVVEALGVDPSLQPSPWTGVTMLALHLAAVARRGRTLAVLDAGVLAMAFLFLPPLVSFALYFTAWHAVDHLAEVKRRRRDQPLLPHACAWTLVSWSGLVGLACAWSHWGNPAATWALVFGFLSVVTWPHVLVVRRAFAPSI